MACLGENSLAYLFDPIILYIVHDRQQTLSRPGPLPYEIFAASRGFNIGISAAKDYDGPHVNSSIVLLSEEVVEIPADLETNVIVPIGLCSGRKKLRKHLTRAVVVRECCMLRHRRQARTQ